VHGYFGDRTGVYPGCKPPVRWGENTNVLWKVWTPNLGCGAPVVAGDRVFVLSEPGWTHDLPVISCYSLADGKTLWEKEIDHLHLTVTNDAERAKVREEWHKHLAWIRDYYLLFHDYTAAKDSPDVKRRMAEMGVETWGQNYLYGKFDDAKVSEYSMGKFARKHPEVGKALVGLDTWRCMGSHDSMWIGEVFGTPCTDGKAIYVATAWGVYAGYDLDGNLRWMHAMPVNRPHDYCSVARSPVIYGGLLISDLGSMVRAFDCTTGAMKWERKRQGGGPHEFVSPVVFRVGQQDFLWCAGPAAYTLPEGKPIKIEGWKNNGMIIAVNTDKPDTIFFNGGGEHGGWENKGGCATPPPAAVRFSLNGDTLTARVLWWGVNGEARVGLVPMVYHKGKVYFSSGRNGGTILDAETGVVVKGLYGGAVPTSGHHMAIAGGHVYGMSENGVMNVSTEEGQNMAVNALKVTPFAALDNGMQTKRLSQWFAWPKAENREWQFSYSSPFAVAGDRILIRSQDHLYCIADKGEAATPAAVVPAEAAEALVVEAEKGKDVWDRVAALGGAAKALVPRIEALLANHREPWRPVGALLAIDPAVASKYAGLLSKAVADCNLHDHIVPQIGSVLYGLGPLSRSDMALIEAKIDQRMYPINGPKSAQDLLSAIYRRDGQVGFTKVHVKPLPWEGVPERGKDVKLVWSTVNATKVRIDPGFGEVEKEGEKVFKLQQTQEYTLTAEGPGGPSVRKVTVAIVPVVREFKAEPAQVEAGKEVTLRWNVANADSVTIDPGVGKVDASGTRTVVVSAPTAFVLTAQTGNALAKREAKVGVK
jgi:outer membrane protein assembly factor BamB